MYFDSINEKIIMRKGFIDVKSEDIFPIIKKYLYTDTDIFLRELISNAIDATAKLSKLVSLRKAELELGDLTIKVEHDPKKKIIKVIDRGIGMTTEEVEKYITQIAFSGAQEFVEKYLKNQEKVEDLIGHFGLGFYSAFMAADKVEIYSKSYLPETKGVHWVCEGTTEYTIEEVDLPDRGTTVILHLSEDANEYNDEYNILNILKKYCRFLPYPIQFGTEKKNIGTPEKPEYIDIPRIINNTQPLWKKNINELKDEDYLNFYEELYPYSLEKPLFWIHLNVDYPFTLNGILYFPEIKNTIEPQRNKIQLYCNQVFVTDNLEDIVPDFLMLLHGVIDTPDIPLNVSRSTLQADANVRKIKNHITKRVADTLEEMFLKDRKDFENKWPALRDFVRFGIMTHQDFKQKAINFALFEDINHNFYTLNELKEKIKDTQTDKNKKIVVPYATDIDSQHSFIKPAIDKGYTVILLNSILDSHFVDFLDREYEDLSFKRIDSDTLDSLIEKDKKSDVAKISEQQEQELQKLFESLLPKDLKNANISISIRNMPDESLPVVMVQPEILRRFREMAALGGMEYLEGLKKEYTMIINSAHPLIEEILNYNDNNEKNKKVEQLIDLALISQNLLDGEKLTDFIKRSIEIMK
jgi:molecular chaperone HtpG